MTSCLACGATIGLFGTSRNAKFRYNKARSAGLEQLVKLSIENGDSFCNRCMFSISRLAKSTMMSGDDLLIAFAVHRIRYTGKRVPDPDKARAVNSWGESVRAKARESEWFKSGLSYSTWRRRQKTLNDPEWAQRARLKANEQHRASRRTQPAYQAAKAARRALQTCPQCQENTVTFNHRVCEACVRANSRANARERYYKNHGALSAKSRNYRRFERQYSFIMGFLT